MQTCEFRDDVAAQLLGGLSKEESLRLDHHVRACDECAQLRREFTVVRSLLDTLPPEPIDVAPSDLGDEVVERLLAPSSPRGHRDLKLVLLGAAASLVLVALVVAAVAFLRRDEPGQSFELVAPAAAPAAWAEVNLHDRIDGTIVDLEAGDLPVDGTRYLARVVGGGAVLAEQEFAVDTDGWAQVLMATSRPMQPGDTIEIALVNDDASVTVLRCDCSA